MTKYFVRFEFHETTSEVVVEDASSHAVALNKAILSLNIDRDHIVSVTVTKIKHLAQ
jgi:hypothetical protein